MSVVKQFDSFCLCAMPDSRHGENLAFFGAQSLPAAPGLVYSETSGTPQAEIQINPLKNRLKRLKHGVITAARLHDETYRKGGFRSKAAMVTLTYRPDVEWSPLHVSELVRHVRQWCARRGIAFRYVWVMELTKAGRPHYHLLIWLPKGVSLPKPDKQGWWKHGLTRIEWARHAVGYMAKYASKGTEGQGIPKGARLHATGGLLPDARIERSWWLSPSWVRKRWPEPAYMPRPFSGGGWVSRLTGEHEKSPWVVVFRYGGVFIRPKAGPDEAHSEGANSGRSEHVKEALDSCLFGFHL